MSNPKDKGVSRRELLTFWRRPLAGAAAAAPEPEPVWTPPPRPRPALDAPLLRPPGAVDEARIAELCTRCGLCVAACPADAIHPLDPEWGAIAGTPAILARHQPCVLCLGLKCTHVCPSGTLMPLHANAEVKMGLAILDEARCVTYAGEPCDMCLGACPVRGAIVVAPDGKVRVEASLCTGCGLCEHVCPTAPQSIVVIPRA